MLATVSGMRELLCLCAIVCSFECMAGICLLRQVHCCMYVICVCDRWGQGVCMSCYALALTPLLSFILQDVEQADNGHTESGVSGLNSCMNVLVCTSEHTLSLVSGKSDNCTRGPDPCNSLINSKKKNNN